MKFLDDMTADRAAEAEVKVDLSGLEKPKALEKLDQVVTYCKRSAATTLYVGFPPARPGAGETLFQPVARYFKLQKFNGHVASAEPVMTPDSAGLFVRFSR
jgi:hypothetical protein